MAVDALAPRHYGIARHDVVICQNIHSFCVHAKDKEFISMD